MVGRVAGIAWGAVFFAGCVSVESSGDVLAPRPVGGPGRGDAAAVAPAAGAPSGDTDATTAWFDFEAEDRADTDVASPSKGGALTPDEIFAGTGLGELPADTDAAAEASPPPIAAAT